MSAESDDAEREVNLLDDLVVLPDTTTDEQRRDSRPTHDDNDERLLAERPPHW
ncbi:MAG TPA: hypothetical protein VHU91_04820 [Mycobacteriales bacterium]|nr:hypothetical protein [Mycobacteriales bacterium]